MKGYLKAKFEELETNCKITNIRDTYSDINDFKKGYRPRTKIVKDEKGDLVADPTVFWLGEGTISPSYWMYMGLMMLGRWIHTAEPLVPEPGAFVVELAIENLRSHKSTGVDHIPAELIKAGCRIICGEICKGIICVWNKEELPEEGRSRSLYLSMGWAIKQMVAVIAGYHFYHLHTKFYPTSCCQG